MPKYTANTERLNSYGFRVLTDGIETADFEQNPICLWMHDRTRLPVGTWSSVEKIGGVLYANDPVIDSTTDFEVMLKAKVDSNTIRACSIGAVILEVSDDPRYKLPGQKLPTVTRCRLREISLVDVPSNSDCVAIQLYDEAGNAINLNDPAVLTLALGMPQQVSLKLQTMDQNLVSLCAALGLGANATLADAQQAIVALKAQNADLAAQAQQFATAETARRKSEQEVLLNAAIEDGRIQQAQRAQFVTLFAADHDTTVALIAGLPKTIKLSDFTEPGANGAFMYQGKTYDQLRRDNPDKLAQLKASDLVTFKQLYKSEYGTDWAE
jgi:hypothetical protein